MRITITMEQAIKGLNIAIHTVSMIIGVIAGILLLDMIPKMYIGKTFLVYIAIIITGYILSRILFCITLKPVVRQMRKRMSI